MRRRQEQSDPEAEHYQRIAIQHGCGRLAPCDGYQGSQYDLCAGLELQPEKDRCDPVCCVRPLCGGSCRPDMAPMVRSRATIGCALAHEKAGDREHIMLISPGEKVHVITRRLFEDDLRRHFAGIVEDATDTLIKVTGYTWVFEISTGEFVRRNRVRTAVFGVADAGLIITVLPQSVEVESLRYAMDATRKRVLTDERGFEMNISEFGSSR